MLEQLNHWLKRPYPFLSDVKSKILTSLGFGFFVFFFLLLFQPFGFNVIDDKFFNAFVFGCITSSVVALTFFLLPLVFVSFFDPNDWVVYKMAVFVFVNVLIIGLVNWYFANRYIFEAQIQEHGLIYYINTTLLVGFFPILIHLFFSERILSKEHRLVADQISSFQKTQEKRLDVIEKTIVLKGSNKNESLKVTQKNLLYITSEKNYASVFYKENNKVKESLLRVSLSKIETQLEAYPSIVRCHKSYIVNSENVSELQGNARNYILKIPVDNLEPIFIPVSRSFPRELLFTLVK